MNAIRYLQQMPELIDKVARTVDMTEKNRLALEAAVMAKNGYGLVGVAVLQSLFAIGPKVGGMSLTEGIGQVALNYSSVTCAK